RAVLDLLVAGAGGGPAGAAGLAETVAAGAVGNRAGDIPGGPGWPDDALHAFHPPPRRLPFLPGRRLHGPVRDLWQLAPAGTQRDLRLVTGGAGADGLSHPFATGRVLRRGSARRPPQAFLRLRHQAL